jgi:hypothetical protein
MGKSRQKSIVDPTDMAQAQTRMGYRGPSVESYAMDSHDPAGEAAYQKAFADAAKMNPPRVPNPTLYTNSPTAQDFIRRKDQELELIPSRAPNSQGKRETYPNVSYDPAQRDMHRVAREALNGHVSTTHHPQPSLTSSHASGRHTNQQPHDSRSNGVQPPPLLMEPKFGPAGPERKLR